MFHAILPRAMNRAAALIPLLFALVFASCAHVPTAKDLERAEIAHDLGVLALNDNRPQAALKEFEQAVRFNPGMAEAHNALGLIYQFSYGRFTEAEAAYRRALKARPDYSQARNNLGVLLAARGDFAEAQAAFEAALADPHYPTPYIAQANLGWMHHLQGRSAEGKQLIRNALLSNNRYCLGHRHLAHIHESEGSDREAELSWERFVRYCPDEPESLLRTAQEGVKNARWRDARRAALKCVEKAPDQVAVECREILAALPPMDPEPEEEELPPDAAGRSVKGSRDLTR